MIRWLAAAALLALSAAPAAAQQSGDDDPAAVVVALFDAMRAKDTTAMRALFHPDARLFTTGTDEAGLPTVQTVPVDRWLTGVANASAHLDERLSDVETRVSGGLATVWTGYDLYVDGGFRHCGVDAFQLARTPAGWRIIQVADTRRRDGCASQGGARP